MADGGRAPEVRQGLFIVMELCWLAGILLLLDAALAAPWEANLSVFGALYPAGYAAGRALRHPARRPWIATAAGVGLFLTGTAALVLAAAPALVDRAAVLSPSGLRLIAAILAVGGFGWARGWMLAGRRVDGRGLAAGFQLGAVMLLVVLGLAASIPVAPGALLGITVVFVVAGLAGLWHAKGAGTGREAAAAGPRGRGPAVAGLAVILAVGFALAAAVDRELIQALLAPLHWLGLQFGRLLAFLAGLLPGAGEPVVPPTPAEAPQPAPSRGSPFALPESAKAVFRFLYGALWVGLVGFVLLRSIHDLARWLQRRTRPAQGIVFEASSGGLSDTLRALLGLLRTGLRHAVLRLLGPVLPGRWRKAAETPVRSIYRRWLRRLAERGWPRAPHETPDAFRRRLAPVWPGPQADVETMTAAFVADRYGPAAVDPGHADAAWRRLRKHLRGVGRGNA